MSQIFQIESLAKLGDAAKWLIETCSDKKLFAFYGHMGSGKTTFIKSVCEMLGALDTVNSPTFAIVNEYYSEANGWLYHLDLYRINKVTEALDFGIEEYLSSNSYCFLEWPENIEDLLDSDIQKVYITVIEDNKRQIEIH